MRRYETICIADPDTGEKNRAGLFDKIKNLITQENGIIVNFDEWGNRQLAYEIRKKTRGFYVCVTYGGTGELVTELERNFRLDDRVLKFMTIMLEKNIDPEKLQQEQEAEKEAEKAAEKAAEKENSSVTPEENDTIAADTEPAPETAPETESAADTDNSEIQPDQAADKEEPQDTEEEK